MRARLIPTFLIAATLILVSVLQAQDKAATAAKKATTVQTTAATQYSCPMHSDVTSDKAGKCSKCGMDLTNNKTTRTLQNTKAKAKKDMGRGCCSKQCSEPCEEK
jgi:hypothetical protein